MMETIMNTIKKDSSLRRGFTLVELIGIMTIIGILVGLATIPMIGMIEQARFKAERDKLAMLAREAQSSFRQDDYSVNLSMLTMDLPVDAALSGTGQPGMTPVDPAVFDANMPAVGELFNANAWYARLAKLRGQAATAWTDGGDLEDIVNNAYHRRRLMIAGPYEKKQQRYILLSFMFHDGPNLPYPDGVGSGVADHGRIVSDASNPDYESWFNVIYNLKWGEKADAVPGGWDAAWGNAPRGTRNYMQRVMAHRIVQPRYTVTVNNNSHSYVETVASGTGTTTQTVYSDRVYVYANMRDMGAWNYSGLSLMVPGREHRWVVTGEPVMIFPTRDAGILEGRRVVIKRDVGTNEDLGNQYGARIIDSFHINQNTTYTAQ